MNLLIGTVVSLLLLLGLTHFPALHVNGSDEAWVSARADDRVIRDMLPPMPTRHDEHSRTSPEDDDARSGAVTSEEPSSARSSGDDAADLARNETLSASALKARAPAHLELGVVRPGAVQASQLRTVRTTAFARNAPRVHSIDVDYPGAARRAGVEGQVVLEFQVNTGGRAHDIEIVQTLHPSCDAEAIRAVREATFVPAQLDGRAVPATTRVAIRFVLSA